MKRRLLPLLLVSSLFATACDGCSQEQPPLERPGVTQLYFSTFHSCALGDDHRVWCAGKNQSGQLGDGTTDDHSTMVRVHGLTDMVGVAVGFFDTSCAWNADGDLYCWGNNQRGAIGLGSRSQSSHARQLDLPPVQSVTLGAYHGCALTTDQEVYCWGSNRDGQLGLGGSADSRTHPTLVEDLPPIRKIQAGAEHTCALARGGGIFCWGDNSRGQLGSGSRSMLLSMRPHRVGLVPGPASDLSASFQHTCALFGDRRELYCWGNNAYGQLGLGDLQARHYPEAIPEIAYVDEFATSTSQTCARIDDTVYCAGDADDPSSAHLFHPSPTLRPTTHLLGSALAICGPLSDATLACRGAQPTP